MKTDIDIKDDLFRFIRQSALHSFITGWIYKTVRPTNSALEDVVISVLANANQEIQEAIVYVNIYVKDILNDKTFVENTPRLREICRLSADLFDVGSVGDARINLQEQRVIKAETNEHVVSNKLLYKWYKY